MINAMLLCSHAQCEKPPSHMQSLCENFFCKKNIDIFLTVFISDIEAGFNTNAPAVLHKP